MLWANPDWFLGKEKTSGKILCAVLTLGPGKRPWHALFISRGVTNGNYCPQLMGINNVHHASETLAVCKEAFTIKQEIAVNQVTNDCDTSEILSFLGKT